MESDVGGEVGGCAADGQFCVWEVVAHGGGGRVFDEWVERAGGFGDEFGEEVGGLEWDGRGAFPLYSSMFL